MCLCNTSRLPLCHYPWAGLRGAIYSSCLSEITPASKGFCLMLSTWLSRSTPWVGCQQQDLPSRELSTGKYALTITKITAHRGIYILSSAPVVLLTSSIDDRDRVRCAGRWMAGPRNNHPPVLFRPGFCAVSWACAGDARRGCVQSEPGFQNDGEMRERCVYRIEDSA